MPHERAPTNHWIEDWEVVVSDAVVKRKIFTLPGI
jgi:hypothetical protein